MPVQYDGQKIKRPGSKHEWSEKMAMELAKCASDVNYFALNHVKVITQNKGVVPLQLRKYQIEALSNFKNYKRNILKWSRQVGKTTITGIYALHKALYSADPINIYILSNKGESAKDFLGRIKAVYTELDPYLKKGVSEWNKTSIVFEDGTLISTSTTTVDAIRGRSASLLILDEFAHVLPHIASEFWTSAQPAIANGGEIIIISTPKGNVGEYYNLYSKAERGENEFKCHKIEWNEVPGRDEEFKEKTIRDVGLQRWLQEYACDFLGSSSTLLNGESLELVRKTVKPPLH